METIPEQARCADIVLRMARLDFPWDMTRALELALFRTFASPRIARLLAATGEFATRARRRYDDTDLLISLILENGPDSPMGRAAIGRINAIHGRFRIPNEDFLYVLSTFVFEPLRWLDRFGWRKLSAEERQGWFGYWRAVGEAMGIEGIPDSLGAFERFAASYEAAHFRYDPANFAVASATRAMFLEPVPKLLHPLARGVIAGLLDEPLRVAVGFAPAPRLAALTHAALRLRAAALRHLPKRRRPAQRSGMPRRQSHPAGWRIESLGPPGGGGL